MDSVQPSMKALVGQPVGLVYHQKAHMLQSKASGLLYMVY